jgi:hypothetical protein
MPGTLLVSLANRFAVRNYLRTGVHAGLRERGIRLVLLANPGDIEPGELEPDVALHALRDTRKGVLENVINGLVFQMLARRLGNATIRIRNQELYRANRWRWFRDVAVSRPLGRSLLAIRGLRALVGALHPDRVYTALFRRVRPDLLLSTNVLDPQEAPVIRQARARGVPVVGQVLSWDNLSSKGVVPAPLDRYLVWNEWMGDEVRRLYGEPADRIRVTGVAQFDDYHEPEGLLEREAFLGSLGLEADRVLLVYAASTARLAPREPRMVAAILGALRRIGLERFHLRVRLHPNDDGARWKRFAGDPDASFETAGTRGEHGWRPTRADMWHFVNLVKHAAVVINVASTTSIDAAALDTPVVNIAFDGDEPEKDWLRSVRRYYSFEHYRRIVDSGGIRVTEDPDACAREIAAYVRDPARDAEGRERIVLENCHRLDGRSAERIVEAIAAAMPGRGKGRT